MNIKISKIVTFVAVSDIKLSFLAGHFLLWFGLDSDV